MIEIQLKYLKINRFFIEMTIKECMMLMDKYKLIEVKKNDKISIKKRIKSKYWHTMYKHYLYLNEFIVKSAEAGEYYNNKDDFGVRLVLLVKIIPLLIDIGVVKRKKKLNWIECIWFDKK